MHSFANLLVLLLGGLCLKPDGSNVNSLKKLVTNISKDLL